MDDDEINGTNQLWLGMCFLMFRVFYLLNNNF